MLHSLFYFANSNVNRISNPPPTCPILVSKDKNLQSKDKKFFFILAFKTIREGARAQLYNSSPWREQFGRCKQVSRSEKKKSPKQHRSEMKEVKLKPKTSIPVFYWDIIGMLPNTLNWSPDASLFHTDW